MSACRQQNTEAYLVNGHISMHDVVDKVIVDQLLQLLLTLKGQLQRKFFIAINELSLYQITIYVIKSLSKI